MNEFRFKKIKEILQANENKQIGLTFAKIGELNGCSGDTVSRVNRSADYAEYRELLKQEGDRKKALRAIRQTAAEQEPFEPEGAKQVPFQTDTSLQKTLAEIRDAIDEVITGLGRIRKATYQLPGGMQTTFLNEFTHGA